MYNLVERSRRRGRFGFTLVELLVAIVALAVLAAIVLPKFITSSRRSKESALRSELRLVRNAVSVFQADTGLYPRTLSDLTATKAPTSKEARALDSSGTEQSYNVADWHGPYLQYLPKDPISGNDFTYSTEAGSVGQVTSSATGSALDDTSYNTW